MSDTKVTLKSALIALAEKVYGMKKEEAETELFTNAEDDELKDGALDLLLERDKKRVDEFKKKTTDSYTKGYDAAKGSVLSEHEDAVRQKYKLQSSKKGLELIDELILMAAKNNEVDEQQVKKHPAYLEIEQQLKKQDKLEKELLNMKSEIAKKEEDERASTLIKAGRKLLDELKPILPTDEAKRERWLKVYDEQIVAMQTEIKKLADGSTNFLLMDPNEKGKRLEDDHGNAIKWDDKAKEIAVSLFDLEESEERESDGDPAKKGRSNNSTKGANGFKKPTSESEYMTMLADLEEKSTPKEFAVKSAELTKLYKGSNN